MKTKKIKSFKKRSIKSSGNNDKYEKKNESGGQEWCLYTDSIPGFEPVIVRNQDNGLVDIFSIEQIEDKWKNLEVWSDEGFVNIKSFIKKPNRKNIFNVRTRKGIVHVTEDHSLIKQNGETIKPNNVEIDKTCLLHNCLSEEEKWNDEGDISKNYAWLYGLFVADGSCGVYDQGKYGYHYSWNLNNSDQKLLNKTSKILKEDFSLKSNVYDTIESSGTKKLSILSDNKKEVVKKFRKNCYTENSYKKVPKFILNSKNREVVLSFLDGYNCGDGTIDDRYSKRWGAFASKSPILSTGISYLLNKVGKEVNVNYRTGHNGNEYYTLGSKNFLREGSEEVFSVDEIEYNGDYVYDLETENNHFGCGIGGIIVHNTDSVFYPARPIVEKQMPETDTENDDEMTDAILEVADDVEEYLNHCYDHFARDLVHIPEHVEHWFDIKQEVIARSGVWVQKKRYAQWIINDEGDPVDELDVKGLDIVRSDFPAAFREVLEEVVVSILEGASKDEVDNKILDFREDLHELSLHEIGRPTSVDLKDYETEEFGRRKKGTPAHVISALNYNDLIDYYDLGGEVEPLKSGSKIRWVYLKKNNLGFEKMGFKGTDDPDEIMDFIKKHTDYKKLYEKSLKSKLEGVYESMDWKFPSENKRQTQKFFSV